MLKRFIVHSDYFLASIVRLAPDWSTLALVVFLLLERQICSLLDFDLHSAFHVLLHHFLVLQTSQRKCIEPLIHAVPLHFLHFSPNLVFIPPHSLQTDTFLLNNIPSHQGRNRLHHGRDLTCFIHSLFISPWSCAW